MSVATSQIKRKQFKKGDILFKEGDIRDYAFIIETGTVDIIRGLGTSNEKPYATLHDGDLFGEMVLIEPGLRSATAIAGSDLTVYIISPDALNSRLKGVDPIVQSLFSLLIERYRFSRIEKDIKHHENADEFLNIENLLQTRKDEALRELALEQEIRNGLDKGQFQPYLQPIVSMPDHKIIGFETLIRWNHPEKGMIFPDEFIPVAERMNLIQAIDRAMLEQACHIIPIMHKAIADIDGAVEPFISVNLSGVNFDDDAMVHGIRDVLNNAKIDPKHIKLEITENAFIGNTEQAAKILESLKALGVTIALDDFGVGYSSLGYLHKFAIDGIKIDRSFIQKARQNQKSMDIIKAIVNLARDFKLGVIAEGIETTIDADDLINMGCIDGQGYLYGKPMPVDQAMKMLSVK